MFYRLIAYLKLSSIKVLPITAIIVYLFWLAIVSSTQNQCVFKSPQTFLNIFKWFSNPPQMDFAFFEDKIRPWLTPTFLSPVIG